MKKIINIFSLALLTFALAGCFDDAGTDVLFDNSKAFVEIHDVSVSGGDRKVYTVVPDGEPVTDHITIAYGGPTPSSDVTVSFEVVQAESTAIEGVDFTLISPGTVTIPAGSFTAPLQFSVVDDLLDPSTDPKTVTIRITGSSAGSVNPSYEKITLSLVGICPGDLFDYETIPGTYDVTTDASSTDGCPANTVLSGFAGTVTITYVSGSVEDGEFVYTLEDSFAGTYIEWYGDCYGYTFETENNITVSVESGAISGSWSSAFSGDSFDVTGSFDFCNGEMIISWVNAFGDEGVTVIDTVE